MTIFLKDLNISFFSGVTTQCLMPSTGHWLPCTFSWWCFTPPFMVQLAARWWSCSRTGPTTSSWSVRSSGQPTAGIILDSKKEGKVNHLKIDSMQYCTHNIFLKIQSWYSITLILKHSDMFLFVYQSKEIHVEFHVLLFSFISWTKFLISFPFKFKCFKFLIPNKHPLLPFQLVCVCLLSVIWFVLSLYTNCICLTRCSCETTKQTANQSPVAAA